MDRALKTIPDLEIFLGRYISKRVRGELVDPAPDELSRRTVLTYVEKGTDVNLATRLLLDGFNRRYESAAMISNDGDLKMPIRVVREELDLHVTVVNPVLHSKHRSAALSPDPLPANASFSSAGRGAAARRPRHFWTPTDPEIARRGGFDHRQDHPALWAASAPGET